jgi:thimet oligopeptidase
VTRIALAFTLLLACPLAASAAAPSPTRINWTLSAAQIKTSCKTAIASAQTRLKNLLAARGRRTFGNTVLTLENLSSDLNDTTVAQQFLFNVTGDLALQQASLDCNNDESSFFTDLTASPQLYSALAAVARSNTARDVYQKELTAIWLDTLKRSGAGLSAPRRLEFVRLSKELTDLQNKFAQNLGNDATTITITAAQATSLPSDFTSGLKAAPGGGLIVPVGESTVTPVLQNEKDEAARQTYYLAYNNREAAANTPLLERAIAIRDRLAHLLGYETWAAYQLSNRTAKTPGRVENFLNGLDKTLLPKAQLEVARLTSIKANETGNLSAVLHPWDVTYYDNVLHRMQYAVDQNQIRQYFPVQHTIDAVLDIYHRLLGVDFKQISPSDAWNPDVLEYSVADSATGRFIGATYFDLYPRPHKYQHFANFPILPVRRLSDGTYRAPFAAVVGNWPRPAGGQPALLSHDDVVTFFHEFGHNMAALLATAPYETLSTGFVWDFVEAPSQMLENFVWQPTVLKEISSNWQTGQPLPDDLISSLIGSRYVDNAYFTTRQIMYAQIDMTYHTSGPHVDTTAVWDRLASELTPMPIPPEIRPQASFGHLMGGYDAGYYGYLWSKVYAQDMFTAFLQGGLENPAVGMRYRRDILQPARTYDPDTEVKRFLGRAMNPNAFYAEFNSPQPPGSTKP